MPNVIPFPGVNVAVANNASTADHLNTILELEHEIAELRDVTASQAITIHKYRTRARHQRAMGVVHMLTLMIF